MDRKLIRGFYKNGHGLDVTGSGSVNFISNYKVLSKSKFSGLLNILLCGKKLKFDTVGYGSRVGFQKDTFFEGAKVPVHFLWGSS